MLEETSSLSFVVHYRGVTSGFSLNVLAECIQQNIIKEYEFSSLTENHFECLCTEYSISVQLTSPCWTGDKIIWLYKDDVHNTENWHFILC